MWRLTYLLRRRAASTCAWGQQVVDNLAVDIVRSVKQTLGSLRPIHTPALEKEVYGRVSSAMLQDGLVVHRVDVGPLAPLR